MALLCGRGAVFGFSFFCPMSTCSLGASMTLAGSWQGCGWARGIWGQKRVCHAVCMSALGHVRPLHRQCHHNRETEYILGRKSHLEGREHRGLQKGGEGFHLWLSLTVNPGDSQECGLRDAVTLACRPGFTLPAVELKSTPSPGPKLRSCRS